MIIRKSVYVAPRARAAEVAKATGVDADAAAAHVISGLAPGFGWTREPHGTNWQDLCRTPDFASLLSDEFPQPGYDMAAYLANRSMQAYLPEDELKATINADGGEDADRFARWTDAALVYRRGRTGVIVFRGTIVWNLVQWAHSNLLLVPVGRPARHLGFLLAWHRLRRQVRAWLRTHLPPDGELLIAGHSLGGAIALLAAFELANDYRIRAVVTIGAPRVGLGRFRDDYLAKPARSAFAGAPPRTLGQVTRRLTHQDDLVSRVPPPPLFRHIGESFRLDNSGHVTPGESRTTFNRILGALDNGVGWVYRTLDAPKTPKPSVFITVPANLAQQHPPPQKLHIVTSASAGVPITPINPILRSMGFAPPKTGIARLWDDVSKVQRHYPILSLVSAHVAQIALMIAGSVVALCVFVLGAFDLRSHMSGLYVSAFMARYASRGALDPKMQAYRLIHDVVKK